MLTGAARAHWRYADVAALADRAPGMEHVRTVRDGGTRRPRVAHPGPGGESPVALLVRQWRKAVAYVAEHPRQHAADDADWLDRCTVVVATVEAVQARADAAPGRWAARGGAADRRILDALCELSLAAVRPSVEAAIRTLALATGIGRTTTSDALARLTRDGWITRDTAAPIDEAAGGSVHGHRWQLTAVIPKTAHPARTQADPRPPHTRTRLLAELSARRTAATHDVFTHEPHALRFPAGNLYARLSPTDPLALTDITRLTGLNTESTLALLQRLQQAGLAAHHQAGWTRTPATARDAAASTRGVTGVLHARGQRYAAERALWAWWQAELAWMHTPRQQRANSRPGAGQLALLPERTTAHIAYPRGPDGRAAHGLARAAVHAGRQHANTKPATSGLALAG